MKEIKDAVCAGRNLDDKVWMAGVYTNFEEKAMLMYKNTGGSTGTSMLGMSANLS